MLLIVFIVSVVFFFLMIRRPPRSTLFPYTTPSDLGRRGAHQASGENCLASGQARRGGGCRSRDRKSTRLNSSHVEISYAVFCLKKKKKINIRYMLQIKKKTTIQ